MIPPSHRSGFGRRSVFERSTPKHSSVAIVPSMWSRRDAQMHDFAGRRFNPMWLGRWAVSSNTAPVARLFRVLARSQPLFELVATGKVIHPKARCTSNVPPSRNR